MGGREERADQGTQCSQGRPCVLPPIALQRALRETEAARDGALPRGGEIGE